MTGKYSAGDAVNTRLQRDELSWLPERMLTEENIAKVDRLREVAADLGMSLPQLGVSWCLKNENVSTVILGASKSEQLTENLKAIELYDRITDEVMERIEGIKILQVDGFGGSGGNGNGGNGEGGGSLSDGLVNSALRFRAQAPLVDQLLREIGIDGANMQSLAGSVSGATASLPSAKKSPEKE